MNVTLLPSCAPEGKEQQHQYLTSYLINDSLAVDAGCLGFWGTPQDQACVKHVLITHTHLDHIASLPIFVDNVYDAGPTCVTIHGSRQVLDCLRQDFFNDRVWPDFVRLSEFQPPFFSLALLEPGRPIQLEGHRVTPIPVNHVVTTFGYLIEEPQAAVLIVSDTGPTERIWEVANATPTLKAVFLEVTFPDALDDLAKISKHLTPTSFARERQKLKRPAAMIAVHIKARFREQVVRELQALAIPNLEIGQFGRCYSF